MFRSNAQTSIPGYPNNAPDDAGTDTHEEVKVFGSTSK